MSLETDVNDLFDSIAFSGETIWSDGYEKGLIKGKEDGKFDGFHLGYHRGAEFGAEIGYYKGIIDALQLKKSEILNEKTCSIIQKIHSMIEKFPKVNSENQDIINLLNSIRSRFKQLCSLLKIELLLPSNHQLSF